MQYCANCTCVNLPDQEIDNQYSDTTPSIRFHIYNIIARFTDHGTIPLKDRKMCFMCKQEPSSEESTKIYTRKELVMMETIISGFLISFYIPAIQRLHFHLSHVLIIGKNHCGKLQLRAFKYRKLFQDFLCQPYYAERLVAQFSHQKNQNTMVKISVSIESIALEHFSALPKADINSTTPQHQLHAVFQYFLSDDSK